MGYWMINKELSMQNKSKKKSEGGLDTSWKADPSSFKLFNKNSELRIKMATSIPTEHTGRLTETTEIFKAYFAVELSCLRMLRDCRSMLRSASLPESASVPIMCPALKRSTQRVSASSGGKGTGCWTDPVGVVFKCVCVCLCIRWQSVFVLVS